MEWTELYEKFYDMPHTEKVKLYDAIKDTLYPEQKANIISMVGVFVKLDLVTD